MYCYYHVPITISHGWELGEKMNKSGSKLTERPSRQRSNTRENVVKRKKKLDDGGIGLVIMRESDRRKNTQKRDVHNVV